MSINGMGEKIKQMRVKHNLSQEEMALRLGVSQPTYSRIKLGKYQRLPLALIEKLASTLETSTDVLVSFQDGLGHLPEYLQKFVKMPQALAYIENAFLDYKLDQRRQKENSRII